MSQVAGPSMTSSKHGARCASGGGAPAALHWRDRLAAQFAAAGDRLKGPSAPTRPQRVVVFSMVPWHHGVVEHLLATSLRLKGAFVRTVVCGGDYPACGMHTALVERPSCERCFASARRHMAAFRLAHESTRSFISGQDFAAARARVERIGDDAGLIGMVHEGIPVGRLAFRDLSQFFRYPVRMLSEAERPRMRDYLVSTMVNIWLARRVADRWQPTHVIISNGKTVAYAGIYAYFRRRGVEVITWDESPTYRNAFTFNRNCHAPEVHLEDVWPKQARVPLTGAQRRQVDAYFGQWRVGRNARYRYHGDGDRGEAALRALRDAARGRPLVTFFSNLTWETSHLERDVGFDHMLSAVFYLIEEARRRPDRSIVIRAHPAEQRVPADLRTVVPLAESIRARYATLPENVTVLPGSSELNSYRLMDASDVICVYTSTIGLEAALAGRACLVLGDCHFRGKGFTVDVADAGQLARCIDAMKRYRDLDDDRVELARRYVYLWVFRHVVRVPYLDEGDRQTYRLDDTADLMPGSGSVMDRLADRILLGQSFLDVGYTAMPGGAAC